MVSGDAEGECSAVLGRIEPRGSNARIVQSAVIGVTGLTITSKPGIATRFPCTRGRCRGNTESTEGACGAHGETEGGGGVRQALCACLAPSQGERGKEMPWRAPPPPFSPATPRPRRSSPAMTPPASLAFGSCDAPRPIEAMSLRKAFRGLHNAFVSKWVLDI